VNKAKLFEKVGYTPHKGQKALHDSDARFKFLVAGRRWGKTTALTKEAETLLMTPGKGWVVANTHIEIMAMIIKIRNDMRQIGVEEKIPKATILEYPWGSRVEGKVAQHPESMTGEHDVDVDWVVWDECAMCDERVWHTIQNALKKHHFAEVKQRWYMRLLQKIRLIKPKFREIAPGKVVMATTPHGINWVYDLWMRMSGIPDWWVQTEGESPFVSSEYIGRMRNTMRQEDFKEQIEGKFV
jgi:hypothetical protein